MTVAILYPYSLTVNKNDTEKYFTYKWPEVDSLNSKGSFKRELGKRKRIKARLKTSLRFSLTWKKNIKSTKYICRKAEMTKKHIKTSGNSYHIETSKLVYIANQFTHFCVKRVFDKRFLEQTIPFLQPIGRKNCKISL